MKILIISPHFHPYFNPRAHRWTSLARHWGQKGWEVHVLCSRGPAIKPNETFAGVIVHRTGFHSLKEVLFTVWKGSNPRGIVEEKKQKNPFSSWIQRQLVSFNERVIKNIYWPDDAFIWFFPAKKKALALLQEHSFDALITVAPPFTTHWLGLYLKRHFPRLYWLADTGDPFAFQPDHPFNNTALFGTKNRQAEADVLARADVFAVTNPGAKQLYERHFPDQSAKIAVIPPLLSHGAETPSLPRKSTDPRLHLGYFGTFFPNIREPGPLLECFRQLIQEQAQIGKEPILHLFGDLFEPFQAQIRSLPQEIRKRILVHGLVERDTALRQMEQMDVLVNLGNTTPFQLPSKTVDYLASGRPILNLQQIAEDASRLLLGERPQICHYLPEGPTIPRRVLHFLEKALEWEMGVEERREQIKAFSLASIAGKYEHRLRMGDGQEER